MLYLITRTDAYDYEEYDAVLVRAASAADAVHMVTQTTLFAGNVSRSNYPGFKANGSNLKVTGVSELGEPEIIIASFNAA